MLSTARHCDGGLLTHNTRGNAQPLRTLGTFCGNSSQLHRATLASATATPKTKFAFSLQEQYTFWIFCSCCALQNTSKGLSKLQVFAFQPFSKKLGAEKMGKEQRQNFDFCVFAKKTPKQLTNKFTAYLAASRLRQAGAVSFVAFPFSCELWCYVRSKSCVSVFLTNYYK